MAQAVLRVQKGTIPGWITGKVRAGRPLGDVLQLTVIKMAGLILSEPTSAKYMASIEAGTSYHSARGVIPEQTSFT